MFPKDRRKERIVAMTPDELRREEFDMMQGEDTDSSVNNVGVSDRWVSMFLGGGLLLLGIARERERLPLLLTGSFFLYRGASGYCPFYDLFGFNTTEAHPRPATSVLHQRGIKVERSIIINKSPEELYRFWRNLENLPRFMSQDVSVQPFQGGARSHWTVRSVAGTTFEWNAEIINDIPNELLAWRSLDGADLDHAGSVRFEKAPDGRAGTEVKLTLEYRPPIGKLSVGIAKLLDQEPAQVISKDLQRLKQLMETGEIASVEGQAHGKAV
jgi:uncharacterized membrane protein